ncbi:MAG: Stk1 family PASTA domain-containing Ser/Thr kinase [Actinomycetota bacterium]|nr:Stk1 family PASTA domain-containing Ser/Thr kinase [Actinomycetota bacterium]
MTPPSPRPDSPPAWIGQVLGGRYRLERPIGHGGMAEVFAARDQRLDRDVAVKVLRPLFADDEQSLARFEREARAAATLNHANVVAVHDYGEDDGRPYLVMELVDGRSLDALIDGGLAPDRALEICTDVCAALGAAHDAGLVHRDIKPANILVADDGTVKVADFGIAYAVGGDTLAMTSVLGTAAYLSPEQAQGAPVDARSDVYSLGTVLYEMLTGSPPFTGDSLVQVALRHVSDTPRPPRDRTPRIEPELEAVVLTSLAKDPADRYPSAEAMRDDLLAVRHGEPVVADHAAARAAAAGVAGEAAARMLERVSDTAPLEPVADPDGGDGDERRRPLLAFVAAALLVAAAGIAALLVTTGEDTSVEVVRVPDVVGAPLDLALARLDARGLSGQRAGAEPHSDIPTGHVAAAEPGEGQEVAPGTVVQLTISSGPPEPATTAPTEPPDTTTAPADVTDQPGGDAQEPVDEPDQPPQQAPGGPGNGPGQPPGQGGEPPGHGGEPPGQAGEPPGQAGKPPGQT